MQVTLNINDKDYQLNIEPHELLSDVLRNNGLKSVKIGCKDGTCGACTIILDGRAVNSCLTFASECVGSKIYTTESLGSIENPHPLQKAFVHMGATQCGYCNPGSLMSAKALLDKNPSPSEEEIKEALEGNLCRCTGYVKRIQAVLHAAEEMKKN